MADGLISIIIPVRNGEKTLRGCVQSAMAQTYENTEVIIVENCSTDSTAVICERLAEDYRKIRIIRHPIQGVSAARNAGLKAASGNYVTFLDADDRMAPDFCRTLYECITKENADISGCSFLSQSDPLEQVDDNKDAGGRSVRIYNGEQFIKEELLHGNVRVWSKLYRADILKDATFREDLTIGEDMVFLAELINQDTRIAMSPEELYWYYRNPMGAMQRPYVPGYQDQINCWDLAEKIITERFPGVLDDPEFELRLKNIQCVSALLVAIKIARLKSAERRKYAGEFEDARQRVIKLAQDEEIRDSLEPGQKVRVFLLKSFQSLFVLSCKFGGTGK